MTYNIIVIILNLASGIYFYRSYPHWSGIAFGAVAWASSDLINVIAGKVERLSTTSRNYLTGWSDGWNSCRSAKPENRVFMRADKVR